MCDCWVTPGRAEGDRGGAARWCSTVCPCLSFPTCKAGGAPGAAGAVGGSRPTAILLQPRAGGFPDSPPRLLALSSLPPRTTPAQGAGPAPVGQGQAFPWGGGGGKNGAKLGDLGISLLFFAVMPGTTTPSPLSPQRSSSSGLSANAFIRLHDAITRSSQKM